jgi:hypothetical protein
MRDRERKLWTYTEYESIEEAIEALGRQEALEHLNWRWRFIQQCEFRGSVDRQELENESPTQTT